jgi:hypothetical protein
MSVLQAFGETRGNNSKEGKKKENGRSVRLRVSSLFIGNRLLSAPAQASPPPNSSPELVRNSVGPWLIAHHVVELGVSRWLGESELGNPKTRVSSRLRQVSRVEVQRSSNMP